MEIEQCSKQKKPVLLTIICVLYEMSFLIVQTHINSRNLLVNQILFFDMAEYLEMAQLKCNKNFNQVQIVRLRSGA